MDLDNFIITKTKRREERGDLAKKKQQLLSKHRAVADDKNSPKTAILHLWLSSQAQSYYPCTMHTEIEK